MIRSLWSIRRHVQAAGVAGVVLLAGCAASGLQVTSVRMADDAESRQVRQGAGEVTVVVDGAGLAGVSSIVFGDLGATVASATAGRVTAVVDVPHGAAIGVRPVQVTGPGGSGSLANALTVSAISAAPDGDDVTGLGTPDRPFRTLTRSVAAAAPGDTVDLRDGLYADGAGGETYPLDVSGLVLQGESQAGVVVDGTVASGGDGLRVESGSSVVRDLTVRDFGAIAIHVVGGSVLVERVTVHDVDEGVSVVGDASAELVDTEIRDSAVHGIEIKDNATVAIRRARVVRSGKSNLDIEGDSDVTVEDSTFSDAVGDNIEIGEDRPAAMNVVLRRITVGGAGRRGVSVRGDATVRIEDSVVRESTEDNVWVRRNGSLVLDGVSVFDSAGDGVDIESSGSLSMRGSTVQGNALDGVDIGDATAGGGPASVDLGTSGDPGGNTIRGNGTSQIQDDRAAGATVVVMAHGNDFGVSVSGVQTGVAGVAGFWLINGAGNQIDFGP